MAGAMRTCITRASILSGAIALIVAVGLGCDGSRSDALFRRVLRCEREARSLEICLEMYTVLHDRYPTEEEGIAVAYHETVLPLDSDIESTNWIGSPGWTNVCKELVDPWGNQYCYRILGTNPMTVGVYSTGQDGLSRSGGDDADDINSWEPDNKKWLPAYGFTYESPSKRPRPRNSGLVRALLLLGVTMIICGEVWYSRSRSRQSPH